MNNLFFDIASHEAIIACVHSGNVIASVQSHERVGDTELIALIEQVLRGAQWEYKDLTHITCVTGPGGFTSLRVGVTCCNVLADQLRIISAGIHLSDVYAARFEEKPKTKNQKPSTLWLHSTKKDQLFVRDFTGQFPEPVCISVDKLQELLSSFDFASTYANASVDKQDDNTLFWCGELIDDHKKILDDANISELDLVPTLDILPELVQSLEYDSELVLPWYGREG